MNTQKSDAMIRNLKDKGPQYQRRMITHHRVFQTTPDKLFPLLCPTREYDWIDGWHCELIYSQSLRQEYNLIIKTDFFQPDEIWVVSHFEPNRSIEFTRFASDISVKVDVAIRDNLDGTSTGDWTIYATALTARGNEMLAQMPPEAEPLGLLIDALEYYITHDSIMPLPAERFNKRS